MLLNCGVGEDSWESILKEISPGCSLERLMLKLKLQYLATWCEELTYLKRSWCWERSKAGGEGDDRGWDGWMASWTQWTWIWVNSGSWWWRGRPGVLRFMGPQRVGHDWVTELNWTDWYKMKPWKYNVMWNTNPGAQHRWVSAWINEQICLFHRLSPPHSYVAGC